MRAETIWRPQVLAGSERLYQHVVITLKVGAEQIYDVVDLEYYEQDFCVCIALENEAENDYLFFSHSGAGKDLEDVFGIAFNDRHLKAESAKRQCAMNPGRAASSADCARLSTVEDACQQASQGFCDVDCWDEVVKIEQGLQLLVESQRAERHAGELLAARTVLFL